MSKFHYFVVLPICGKFDVIYRKEKDGRNQGSRRNSKEKKHVGLREKEWNVERNHFSGPHREMFCYIHSLYSESPYGGVHLKQIRCY